MKNVYTQKMTDVLADTTKFRKVKFHKNNPLRRILNKEIEVREAIKELHANNKISNTVFNKLWPTGSQPGILYGLAKVHKPVELYPKVRPILSAVGTPTHSLAKFLVPFFSKINNNEYTVKDSFQFSKEIVEQDSGLYMCSLDVESLFTNLPLDETINIICNNVFRGSAIVNSLDVNEFRNLLNIATKDAFFTFNREYYEQIDGVAMGSPLGPDMANAFLCEHERDWLDNCPEEFKPVLYRRYVDDVFCLFKDKASSEQFRDYLNKQHLNIKFTIEHENNNNLPFLDCNITRENGEFSTSVFRKKSFSGVYSHFDSFLPSNYKENLLLALIHRCFTICSSFTNFHLEIVKLKDIMKRNSFPSVMIDSCIKKYLDKVMNTVPKVASDPDPPKEILTLVLPFLGRTSLKLRNKLREAFKTTSNKFSLRVVFRASCRMKSFLRFKDRIPEYLKSHFVYEFKCNSCNAVYIGVSTRHYCTRKGEHFRKSEFTGKHMESRAKTSVYSHFEKHGHWGNNDESFSLLAVNPFVSEFVLQLQESILIARDKPPINENNGSVPLFLFN